MDQILKIQVRPLTYAAIDKAYRYGAISFDTMLENLKECIERGQYEAALYRKKKIVDTK